MVCYRKHFNQLSFIHSVKAMLKATSLAVYVNLFALQERSMSRNVSVIMD